MSAKKMGLGRGLNTLIPKAPIVDEEDVEQVKKKVSRSSKTKKKEEIKSANSEKSNRKKFEVKKYKCPITVHGGPYSYIIEKDDDEEMSAVKVKNHILKTFPELKGILSPNMQEDGSCILHISYHETKLSQIKDCLLYTSDAADE